MRSPVMFMTAAILAGAALTGCATSYDGDGPSKPTTYQKLSDDCTARGGMLVPIPGATSSEESANYACEFHGQSPKPLPGDK